MSLVGRVRKRVITAVRTDPRLRRVTYAAVDAVVKSGPVAGLRGAPEETTDPDAAPVVLVVLLQASAGRIERLARIAAELQAVGVSFRPLFLLDFPDFAPLRRYGFAGEYVAPHGEASAAGDWTEVFATRLRECRESYAPVMTVMLPVGELDAAASELWDREMLAAAAASAATAGSTPGRATKLRRWIDKGR